MSGLAGAIEELSLPVIAKPTSWQALGKAELKAQRLDGAAELREQCAKYMNLGASLILQEYIPGGDDAVEVMMFYRSRTGQQTWATTGRKLRQNPLGSGIMAFGRAEPLDHILRDGLRFLNAIDYRGLGGLEFKRSGGRSYFIEASVRLDGFHPLAIQAGMDLPWLAYADTVNMADTWLPSPSARQQPAFWLDERAWLESMSGCSEKWKPLTEVVRSLVSSRLRLGVLSATDPGPAIWHIGASLCRKARSLFGASEPRQASPTTDRIDK